MRKGGPALKRKLPRWAVYLIGTVVSFVLTALLLPLEDTALGGLATNLGILCIFAHLAFLVALIVHLLRRGAGGGPGPHADLRLLRRRSSAGLLPPGPAGRARGMIGN